MYVTEGQNQINPDDAKETHDPAEQRWAPLRPAALQIYTALQLYLPVLCVVYKITDLYKGHDC